MHKLIVAARRSGAGWVKAAKDAAQAGSLIPAMAATRQGDSLREAGDDAAGRGPHWRQALAKGRGRLEPEAAEVLAGIVGEAPD